MDRQSLKQISDIRMEIRNLERAEGQLEKEIDTLNQNKVYVNVIGSRQDLTIGPIKVRGHPKGYEKKLSGLQKKKALIEKKRTELLQLENKAVEYILSIEDSGLRQIIMLRYIDDLSWQQVAARMGYRYSAESCRKKAERFMSG